MSGSPVSGAGLPAGRAHLARLHAPLAALYNDVDRLGAWGRQLAAALRSGHRLLAAGNGGSAAQAQHLTAELVGRYCDDRMPFSALALHADSSSFTAISNDYGVRESFARQVRAHGRAGDAILLLSTSGGSANVVAAAEAARERSMTVWALTGPAPNPLQARADDAVCVDSPATATVQECHLVCVHLLCAAVDVEIGCSQAAVSPELQ